MLFNEEVTDKDLFEKARSLGREFVIKVTGIVIERQSKNPNIPTGNIEVQVSALDILNPSK